MSELFMIILMEFGEMIDDLIKCLQIKKLFGYFLLFTDKKGGQISDHVLLGFDCLKGKVRYWVLVNPYFNLFSLVFANAMLPHFEHSVLPHQLLEPFNYVNNLIFVPFLYGHHSVGVDAVYFRRSLEFVGCYWTFGG